MAVHSLLAIALVTLMSLAPSCLCRLIHDVDPAELHVTAVHQQTSGQLLMKRAEAHVLGQQSACGSSLPVQQGVRFYGGGFGSGSSADLVLNPVTLSAENLDDPRTACAALCACSPGCLTWTMDVTFSSSMLCYMFKTPVTTNFVADANFISGRSMHTSKAQPSLSSSQ